VDRLVLSILGAVAAVVLTAGTPSDPAEGQSAERVVLANVDRYRMMEPMFEGVRVVLNSLGETYSPAYIQGISGAAFRFGGPCPCAPTCSVQMQPTDLLKLLGYDCVEYYLGDDAHDARLKPNTTAMIASVKASIHAGRPVLVWHAFTTAEWDVVAGFDDAESVFLGRGSYMGLDGYAKAMQGRAQEAGAICPAFGALVIGQKTGVLDAHAAEVTALRDAVRHAHDRRRRHRGGPGLEGLLAYDRWAAKFRDPQAKRDAGDSYCLGVYRSTHRAAGRFLREIAPRYPDAAALLLRGALQFTAEAGALDQAAPLLGWNSPEHDAARNAKLWPLLTKARDHYAAGIALVEEALPLLS
jgi:hypothetical protein